MRLMKPTEFSDISAVGALYRPGPMGANSHTNYALRKNGRQEIEPIHPALSEALADILDETYGLIVYQEQVMAIAQKVAGYSLGQADILRRAMGKKKKKEMDKQYSRFHDGMIERGYPEEAVSKLWEILVPFSSYAFNKSHSAAYGLVSYWTAYLKANYPTEYMAALLTSTKDNKDKLALYLRECRRMNIAVLPPDVNASASDFTAVGESIRFGLSAVRNVGTNVVAEIVKTRTEKGAFTSFHDFLDKVPIEVCNKRVIESLIKAGAFDSLGHTRRPLESIHIEAVDSVIDVKRNAAMGQEDLFGSMSKDAGVSFTIQIPDLPEWDKSQKLKYERDMLGLYVSDHPLQGMETILAHNSDTEIIDLSSDDGVKDGQQIQICGLITGLQRKTTKRDGNLWAIATIEDISGATDVLFFPQTYQKYSQDLVEDEIVSVRGRVRVRDDEASLYAQELTLPDISQVKNGPLNIYIPANRLTEEVAGNLREVLASSPGQSPVRMHLYTSTGFTIVQLGDNLQVNYGSGLAAQLKTLLGLHCLEKRK